MEGHSQAIAVMDRAEVAFCKPQPSPRITHSLFSDVSLWDRLPLFVGPIPEYVFGAHIGFAASWLVGFLLGNIYVEYSKPAWINDLSQLSYWEMLPCGAVRGCASVGIVNNIVVISIVESKPLRCSIITLCQKGIAKPEVIPHRLVKNKEKIRKAINQYIKKNKNNF